MIVKKTLSEQIYESLKRDIFSKEIVFGSRLVNRELQAKFGVSSTPIRDAINRLSQDGLVEDITQGGAKVLTLDINLAMDVNDMVSLLNVGAIKLASERGDMEVMLRELKAALVVQEANIDNDRYYAGDKQFHDVFFRHCDNAQCSAMHDKYTALQELLVREHHCANSRFISALEQHYVIYDALKIGDTTRAKLCMEEHYDDANIILMESFHSAIV